MNKLIEKFGLQRMKIAMIVLTTILAVAFVISVILAISTYNNFNEYTTITM